MPRLCVPRLLFNAMFSYMDAAGAGGGAAAADGGGDAPVSDEESPAKKSRGHGIKWEDVVLFPDDPFSQLCADAKPSDKEWKENFTSLSTFVQKNKTRNVYNYACSRPNCPALCRVKMDEVSCEWMYQVSL